MSWEEMQKLVHSLYNKFFKRYARFKDDLISCGYLGVSKALKRYDAESSVKLSTYVCACAMNEMRFFLRKEMKHYNNRVDDIEKVQEIIPSPVEVLLAEYEVPMNEKDREIIKLVCDGYSLEEIGDQRGVCRYTVSKRLKKIQSRCRAMQEYDDQNLSC